MAMTVAFVSRPEPEAFALRALLEGQTGLRVIPLFDPCTMDRDLDGIAADLFIVRLPRFRAAHLEIVLRLRSRLHSVPVVFLAPHVDEEERVPSRKMAQVAVLDTRFEITALVGLMRRFNGPNMHARLFARGWREEKVQVIAKDGRVQFGRFVNFGKLGACIELNGEALESKSRVLIAYSSSARHRSHRLEAVVVWMQKSEGFLDALNGTFHIGVKFIAIAS